MAPRVKTRFSSPRRTTEYLVAQGGIEPPTQGFSVGQNEKYMLLSPMIFREFVQSQPSQNPELDFTHVQDAIEKAKWNVSISPGNINILRFKAGADSQGTGGTSVFAATRFATPSASSIPFRRPTICFSTITG